MKFPTNLLILALALFSACSSSHDDKAVLREISSQSTTQESQAEALAEINDLFSRELYSASIRQIKSFRELFPLSPKIPELALKEGEALFEAGRYEEAISALEDYRRTYGTLPGNDFALFLTARSYFEQYGDSLRDKEPLRLAGEKFEELKTEFPQSKYVKEAEPLLEKIWQENASYEFDVAEFYLEADQLEPAASRVAIIDNVFKGSQAEYKLENLLSDLDHEKKASLLALKDVVDTSSYKPFVKKPESFALAAAPLEPIPEAEPRYSLIQPKEKIIETNIEVEAPEAKTLKTEVQKVEAPRNLRSLLGSLVCKAHKEGLVFSTPIVDQSTERDFSVQQFLEKGSITHKLSLEVPREGLNDPVQKCSLAGVNYFLAPSTGGENFSVLVGVQSQFETNQYHLKTSLVENPLRIVSILTKQKP